ncbi:MAG: hypothetical protein WHS88_05765 [Anaerohalosphaeraceae bacterium]
MFVYPTDHAQQSIQIPRGAFIRDGLCPVHRRQSTGLARDGTGQPPVGCGRLSDGSSCGASGREEITRQSTDLVIITPTTIGKLPQLYCI